MTSVETITVSVDEGGVVSARTPDGQGPNEHGQLSADKVDAMMIRQFADRLGLRDERSWTEKEIRVFGQLQHRYLFPQPSDVWRWIQGRIDATPEDSAIRLRLAFPEGGPYAALAAVPWEYLHTPELPGREGVFLATHRKLWLTRYVPAGAQSGTPDRAPLLSVLPVVANPDERLGKVDATEVLGVISSLPGSRFRVVDPLRDATKEALRKAVADNHPNVVHYVGHGKFDESEGLGKLALHDPAGRKTWVDENELAEIICPDPALAPLLVVLHTCEGGRADFTERFAGIGPRLIRRGVRYVVGMQYAVRPSTATAFSRALYSALSTDPPASLDEAVQAGRSALGINDPQLLGVPVLFQAEVDESAPAADRPPATPISHDFHIIISATGITATCGPSLVQGKQVGKREDLPSPESLTMDSIVLFDRWLNQWERIDIHAQSKASAEIRHGLGADTFEIVGQLLWNLILDNSIGDELKLLVASSRRDRLKVYITFDDAVDPGERAAFGLLRALPWEFLYVRNGREGTFLAAAAKLQLARYVRLPESPTEPLTSAISPKLRVQFVTAIPDDSEVGGHHFRKYGGLFTQVRTFAQAVNSIPNIDAPDPVDGVDFDLIAERINKAQPHVIHVVGLCRGSPGDPQMLLGGTDNDGWGSPKPLVNALTSAHERPLLVILHLSEVIDGDASENFERLAPPSDRRRGTGGARLAVPDESDQ